MSAGGDQIPLDSSPPPGPARDEPRRILLVEDDAGDALLAQERLKDAWPEVAIIHASSLKEAERSLGEAVDCVVLDLGLPDARGLDALARVQAAMAETAVVVLTGDSDERRGIEALSAGAQDYIVKGEIDGEGLARAIGYSIQRKRSERAARELAMLRLQAAETARVQRGLVPALLLDDERLTVRSTHHSGTEQQPLGGDFFDVVQSAPHVIHVVLGEVSGRGPDESALGVQLRIAWRTLILANARQETVLTTLDRLTSQERHADHVFATMATVRIDLRTGVASVALAGHPPPVVAADGHARLLVDRVGGPPLGMDTPGKWEICEVELGSQWTLLLYSDGLYEGRVSGDGARLGLEAFVELLSERAERGTLWSELPELLIAHVESLNNGPLDDDVALLALRFDGDLD
jgi:serine phosphatase RsbU (regulator of sigma subunit)